jgi:hypothetical protein
LPAEGQNKEEGDCAQDVLESQAEDEAVRKTTKELWDKGYRLEAGKRDIHAENSRRFMTEELGAGDWHRQILQEGFYSDFVSTPRQYREDNNLSAKRSMNTASRESALKAELIPLWIGDRGLTTEESSHSTDEWGLDKEHLQQLLQEFQIQPTMDGFASHLYTRCQKFCSKTGQPGTTGIDFFAQELLAGEIYYCCPPVKLAAHCIRKIWSSKNIKAVLVLPHWTGATYWPLLLEGDKYQAEIKQWHSWQAANKDSGQGVSLFTTGRNIQMWAGRVETGKK